MPLAQVSSVSDLDAVKKVLQDPLTGRRVLIPFTSKAFFEGSLQPTIASSGKEQVLVKITKKDFVETSRSEAMEMVEKRIQAVLETVRKITKKTAAASASTRAAAEPSSLPFFEIREEFDEQGNEIKSEAINVAKELEYLQRNEDGKIDSAVRAVPSKNQPVSELEEKGQPTTNKPVITEEEYQDLTSRFNELARLEEEADSNKKINQTSFKKLQGSGWAKGFLNKKKPAAKKKPIAAAPAGVDQAPRTSTGRKVGFQEEDNQVKEIPRVGERSVPSRTPSNSHTKPIETSVFNGVIQERPTTVGVQERTATASAGVQERAATSTPTVPPKKKLSRFAQQRLEQQQQLGASEPTKKLSKFAQERQAKIR